MFNKNFKNLFGFLAVASLIFTSFASDVNAGSHEKKKKESFAAKCNPMEVVIHASYGGGTDQTARMMSIRARKEFDTDIQVVGKRGGSGSKAQNYVKSKPADGCTIMALTESHLYTMARGKSDMKISDITGIVRAMEEPTFIVINAQNTKIDTVKKLISESKKKPITTGIASIGGTEHIGMYQWSKASGTAFKPVSFGSGAQSLQALASGKIDVALLNPSEAAGLIADKKVKAVVLLAPKRLKDYPDVPSSYELGYKVNVATTRGYAVLASTPDAIKKELSAKLLKGMKHEIFASYLKGSSLDPETSPAGMDVWEPQLKANYKEAAAALKELGLLK